MYLTILSITLSNRLSLFFFFNDTATTEIYTLSLHDALPISRIEQHDAIRRCEKPCREQMIVGGRRGSAFWRSEEHTSELQSQSNLVCRLLLEKKKNRDEHVSWRHSRLQESGCDM